MLNSILRGLPRILVLVALGIFNLLLAHIPDLTGLTGGPLPVLCPLAYGVGLVFLCLGAGDLALRILQPQVDPQQAAKDATEMGYVYLGRCILAAIVLFLMVTAPRMASGAEMPPAAAVPLLPVLQAQQRAYWPDMPLASALGAQVEQETGPCPGRSCWNPHAELRTHREQGVGLGQLTRAFRPDGSTRFDALGELTRAYPKELAGLSWDNRFDPVLQLRALVLKDRQGFLQVHAAATPLDQLSMAFAAYNGGAGGLASDRRACAATRGCDAGRWFGNVERTSLKAKAAVPGYGASFFSINRQYVKAIMIDRRVRYLSLDVRDSAALERTRREDVFQRVSVLEAPVDRRVLETQLLGPLFQRLALSPVFDERRVLGVVRLFLRGGPSAVAWLVVADTIRPSVQGMAGRTLAHVSEEVLEADPPPDTNRDAAATVLGVRDLTWIRAAVQHRAPPQVGGGLRTAMRRAPGGLRLLRETAARPGAAIAQKNAHGFLLVSAVASAVPYGEAVSRANRLQRDQSPEALAGQVDLCHERDRTDKSIATHVRNVMQVRRVRYLSLDT